MDLTDLRVEALRNALISPREGNVIEMAEKYFEFLAKDFNYSLIPQYNGYMYTPAFNQVTDFKGLTSLGVLNTTQTNIENNG